MRAKQSASERHVEASSSNDPYDVAESGNVRLPMWCDNDGGGFVFGLRWMVLRDGVPKYRRTVSVKLFEDVISGLSELAGKYAEEKRLPAKARRVMREYHRVLKVVPDSVRAELAEKQRQGPRPNGGDLSGQQMK